LFDPNPVNPVNIAGVRQTQYGLASRLELGTISNKIMRFVLTKHAQEEILRRHIPKDLVVDITQAPDQIVEEHGGIISRQPIAIWRNNRLLTHLSV